MTARFPARPYADNAEFLHRDDRSCAPGRTNPEIFFSAADTDQEAARRTCRGCPVRIECLQYAITRGDRHGVWGAVLMSAPAERRKAVLRDHGMFDAVVHSLWRRGLNDVQAAEHLGIDKTAVRYSRVRQALPARDRGRRRSGEVAA